MKAATPRTVKLDIASRIEMLDMVQTVLHHLSVLIGFQEDDLHFMTVAVRESVVNAIKHGNQCDLMKKVIVRMSYQDNKLSVIIEDEGVGFDPAKVQNPLLPENLLKSTGRGIFYIKSFMDDVEYEFKDKSGTILKMKKQHQPA